jgi:hypothetical protein
MRDGLMRVEDISETIDRRPATAVEQVFGRNIPAADPGGAVGRPGAGGGLPGATSGFDPPDPALAGRGRRTSYEDRLRASGLRAETLAEAIYHAKVEAIGPFRVMKHFEKTVMPPKCWTTLGRSILAAMDHLRQGIHLRGYAQKDPRQE